MSQPGSDVTNSSKVAFQEVCRIATALEVTLEAARYALEANGGDVEDAVHDLLFPCEQQDGTDGTGVAQGMKPNQTLSNTAATALVAETCGVSLLVAEAKLIQNEFDIDAAVEDLLHGDDSQYKHPVARSRDENTVSFTRSRAEREETDVLPRPPRPNTASPRCCVPNYNGEQDEDYANQASWERTSAQDGWADWHRRNQPPQPQKSDVVGEKTTGSAEEAPVQDRGRKTKLSIIAAAKITVTYDLVRQCVDQPVCRCHCFQSIVSEMQHTDQVSETAAVRKLACSISDWREDLIVNDAGQRGKKLLSELHQSYNHQGILPSDKVKKTAQMKFRIPGNECHRLYSTICLDCWGLAANVASIETSKRSIKRSSMLGYLVSSFNSKNNMSDDNLFPSQSQAMKFEGKPELKDSMTSAILVWLQLWLPGNVDISPMDPRKMHLDAPSRRFVFNQMQEDWENCNRDVPAYNTFLRVMRDNFSIVVHKHKKFAECEVCSLYKELWAKSRHESETLRHEIKALRKSHFDQQYIERMEYYIAREQSFSNADDYVCIMIDAMTETSTSVPMQRRSSKGLAEPVAFGTALFGALVHGPEGFQGYTVNGLKGARACVEVLHRTLLNLKKSRKVWPAHLILQLDNTTSDNKNHTVFAYAAWLVATGVFESVQIRFLLVGHTHEDIDGCFGLLRRYLMRQEKGVITIDQLHQHIKDCFDKSKNKRLSTDIAKEALSNAKFNYEAMSKVPQHIWATYDWTKFLLEEYNVEQGRAFAQIDQISQSRDPDVFRPHCFVFGMEKGAVTMNVKHWASDGEYWNTEALPVWNRIPQLKDLRPCPVVGTQGHESVYGTNMYRGLQACQTCFEKTGLRCKSFDEAGRCPKLTCRKVRQDCKCEPCCRCTHLAIVKKYVDYSAVMDVTQDDYVWWERHFDKMAENKALATLIPIEDMELPKCERQYDKLPSIEEQIAALPALMKRAPKGLKLRLGILGWNAKVFKQVVTKSKKSAKATKNAGKDMENLPFQVEAGELSMIVAAIRSSTGKVEYAVILDTGDSSRCYAFVTNGS